jgi:hypothetical protein
MSTGLNDIEQEETPQQRLKRIRQELGRPLNDIERSKILDGTYVESRQSNSSNSSQNNSSQNQNGNVSTLANSDPTGERTDNVSGLQNPPPTPPPPPPQPVLSYGTYNIFVKPGINGSGLPPHDKIGTHPPKMYQTYKGGDYTEERIFRFCKCEGDPDDVGFIRSEARMGFAPRGIVDRAKLSMVAGYYVKFPKQPDPGDPEGNYAPEYEDPLWILNQNDRVKYIGDDQCPEGKKRLTADGVQLGEVDVIEPSKDEVINDGTTITYQKVEIQPIEYIGYNFITEDGSKLPTIKSLKFPPVIIDSITIPTGSNGTVVLDDIDIIREPYVVSGQTVKGEPPSKIVDDVQIKPMTFLSDKIQVKNNVPITFRSITFPIVIVDSITHPENLSESAEIESIVVSEEPIILPGKEYSKVAIEQKKETIIEATGSDIKNETIILKNVELKVPIKDRTTGLKFWNVMTDKPVINLDDPKNEQLTLKIKNIMIPINPRKKHTLDKMETSKLTINKNLIDYVPDQTQPNDVAKEKYIIYTMQGKTVPDVGDVYSDDDNGDRIYYGVNQPFRDKTPVKNDFEYCKCSGDDAKTSENRGYARLGILLGGNVNKKYFKRDRRDEIAGTLGKYIGDDKCPDGETQVTNGKDADQGVLNLIPDKEEIIKFDNVVIDTKKIVNEDTTEQYKDLTPDIVNNLPEITIKMVDVPLILEGGSVKGSVDKIDVDFSKLTNKEVNSSESITVPKETPPAEVQKESPPPKEIGKSEQKGGSKSSSKKDKPKENAKTKGKDTSQKSKIENVKYEEEAIKLQKGRTIPSSPGLSTPTKFSGKGTIAGAQGKDRVWYEKGMKKFADWQWTWPITTTYNPGNPKYRAENFVGGESRPSGLGYWWYYFSNWKVSEPIYNWNGGSIPEFINAVGKNIMWDEQFAPFSMAEYKKNVGKLKLNEDIDTVGKAGEWVTKPLNWSYIIWKDSSGWKIEQSLPGKKFPNDYRYPYMAAGRNLIRQYIPYGFNADWGTLLSKFRFSKKVDPSGGDPNSPYGGSLPNNYTPSLLDVGLLMNFFQCGYVTRYKLPNGAFPPFAASGTEQHLMMLDGVQGQWVYGFKGDPMIGTFNAGKSIVLNWAHEPHWCGISTDFFLRRGGFGQQGTTSVKSNEENIINGGFPLNRPRLEESIDAKWDPEKWEKLSGAGYGVSIREKFKEAYSKYGADFCEHPITDEYLNDYRNKINSIWFIGGIHYDPEKGEMTKRGYDLLRKAINPDIIDWPAAIISHTGHVESVAALDVDGEVIRLGGNTSTHGNFGNVNNTMGLYRTHISKFGGYPGGGERGGFVLISKPDGISEANRKHRVGGKGISAPFIITDVMRTYYDFLENNPEPDFPVFKNYYDAIQTINTIFNSNLR